MPTILVIEDDEQSRFILTVMLKNQGFQVLQACDGYAGLEAARQAQPDLILLDILLPGLDGYAVAHALRDDPKFANTPILAETSLPMMGNRDRALAAGCTDYIEKPIDEEILITKIKQYLVAPS